ncbi:hypothetical protein ACTHGU_07585 [Chitinophagaceae bacterium MMS25-I14]
MKVFRNKILLSAAVLLAGSTVVSAQMTTRAQHTHIVSYKATQNEFQAHLLKVATDRVKSAGYFMSWDVHQSMKGFINDGVMRMYQQGTNDDERRAAAEGYIEKFTTVMIDDAQKRGISSKLDMISFRNAHNMSCPRTPFCM